MRCTSNFSANKRYDRGLANQREGQQAFSRVRYGFFFKFSRYAIMPHVTYVYKTCTRYLFVDSFKNLHNPVEYAIEL